jgi:hypothetical protein
MNFGLQTARGGLRTFRDADVALGETGRHDLLGMSSNGSIGSATIPPDTAVLPPLREGRPQMIPFNLAQRASVSSDRREQELGR